MPSTVPGPLQGRRIVQTIVDRSVTYEQRVNTCGKANCKRCNGVAGDVIGHGPYWYYCVALKSRWIRIYLGKFLDTARFRTPDGSVDWGAVLNRKARAKTHPAAVSQEPPPPPAPPRAPPAAPPPARPPGGYAGGLRSK